MAAPLTDVGRFLRQAMKASAAIAFRTETRVAEPLFQQVIEAHVIGRETPGELLENRGLHRFVESQFSCG